MASFDFLPENILCFMEVRNPVSAGAGAAAGAGGASPGSRGVPSSSAMRRARSARLLATLLLRLGLCAALSYFSWSFFELLPSLNAFLPLSGFCPSPPLSAPPIIDVGRDCCREPAGDPFLLPCASGREYGGCAGAGGLETTASGP